MVLYISIAQIPEDLDVVVFVLHQGLFLFEGYRVVKRSTSN
jgi:hypothetical protein